VLRASDIDPSMRPVLLLLLLLSLLNATVSSQKIGIPADLLATALNHAAAHPDIDNGSSKDDLVQRLNNGDIDALYWVAKSMNDGGDRINSVLLWHQLADSSAHHILSMVALGFAYAENDKAKAVRYFVQAGEDGPHQSALYNAGRLYVELEKPDRALAYLRASVDLSKDTITAVFARPQTTAMVIKAYGALSELLRESGEFTLQQILDMFPYASIDNFPVEGSEEGLLWTSGMEKLREFVRTRDRNVFEVMRGSLTKLQSYKNLSKLQHRFLDDILKEALELYDQLSTDGADL